MPTFTVTKNITTEVQQQFEETFDSDDQDLWDRLRENASAFLTKSQMKAIPKEASDNLEHWLLLYKHLPSSSYAEQSETLEGAEKIQWVLENSQFSDEEEVEQVYLAAED